MTSPTITAARERLEGLVKRCEGDGRDQLAADLRLLIQAVGVGEGWRVVPIEPSEEMLAAADSAIPRFEAELDGSRLMGRDGALEAWNAMINAAPEPPHGE